LPVGDNQVDVAINCNGETILARITRLSAERLALEAGVSVFAIIKSVSFEQTRGSVSA
jgi:molybdate transport system ATP-binding protein